LGGSRYLRVHSLKPCVQTYKLFIENPKFQLRHGSAQPVQKVLERVRGNLFQKVSLAILWMDTMAVLLSGRCLGTGAAGKNEALQRFVGLGAHHPVVPHHKRRYGRDAALAGVCPIPIYSFPESSFLQYAFGFMGVETRGSEK